MIEIEISERFQKLEKKNRQLRLTIGATALMMLALVGLAAAPQTQFYKTLNTRSLQLVDENGETRATLDTDGSGNAAFSMTPDSEGTLPVLISAGAGGVGHVIIGGMPEVGKGITEGCVYLTNNPALGNGLHVTGKDGTGRIAFATEDDGRPYFQLKDTKGEERIHAGIGESNMAELVLFSADGKGQAGLRVAADSSSYLLLAKEVSSKEASSFAGIDIYANRPEEGNGLRITDTNGSDRICLACPDIDRALLQFTDAGQKVRLSAGLSDDVGLLMFMGADEKVQMSLSDTLDTRPEIAWYDKNEDVIKTISDEESAVPKKNTRKKT